MSLTEIRRPVPPDDRPIGDLCPVCGVPTRHQMIACPDGLDGCCVAHYGWHCDSCGRDFR